MPLIFSGPSGEIRWSYRRVAVLGEWTKTDDWVSAQIVSADSRLLTQPGLQFYGTLSPGRPPTIRPIASLQRMDDATIALRLGPKEGTP